MLKDFRLKNYPNWLKIVSKAVVFLPVFLLLHYAYKWVPWPGLAWFSSTGESVYEHMKIAFFTYGVISTLEFFAVRPATAVVRDNFLYTRLLATVLVPWGIFFGWFIAPAVYGAPMPTPVLELLYANGITLAVMAMMGVIERSLETFAFPKPLRIVLWIILAVLLLEFVVFSYRLPWSDVFTVPLEY
jgi:hypothetical protein